MENIEIFCARFYRNKRENGKEKKNKLWASGEGIFVESIDCKWRDFAIYQFELISFVNSVFETMFDAFE